MQIQPHDHSASTTQPASMPPMLDYVLIPRATLAQIQLHIAAEQERFPTRRLRQALRIIQHVLGNRTNETV